MSLAFSLLAALLAILVQRWVRDYMNVFHRYGDPLKSARLRQYLYEGCKGWYMPRVAEVVPGFLHISLFLFFAGLGNSLMNINTKVALTTIVPISISGLLYILITFAPIIYPQSPYQNSFSGIFWYLFQKSRGRRFKDRGLDGEVKSVSTDMAQGQMQLAMEETKARKDRDVQAIRWLIDNLTEDTEMETFLSAIPGSFNTDWGTEVWKTVGEHHENGDQSQDGVVARPHPVATVHQPSSWRIRSVLRSIIYLVRKPTPHHSPTHTTTCSPVPHPPNVDLHSTTAHIRGEDVVHELSTRVARSVEICKNRKLFTNEVLWRKRTRTCIEATASLVCCANANLAWFGGISKLLGDIGSFEKIRELPSTGTDQLFVIRWTCLSLVALRQILANNSVVQDSAKYALKSFAKEDDTGNNDALAGARKISDTIHKAIGCLFRLCEALEETEELTEEVAEILRRHESEISELEQIDTNIEADSFEFVDSWISTIQSNINTASHRIISQVPGSLRVDKFIDYFDQAPIPFSRMVELSRDTRKIQFIQLRQTLKAMCSPAITLRNILEGQRDADAYKELLKNLTNFRIHSSWSVNVMQRQLWRLHDLYDGGGLGFTVELFFLAISKLLSTSSTKESRSLYTGTFRAITSDWSKYKHSLGTQNHLLYIVMTRCRPLEGYYPVYIVDEFVLLLNNIFEGQTGPHIDKARRDLESFELHGPGRFTERVLKVLTKGQAESLAA